MNEQIRYLDEILEDMDELRPIILQANPQQETELRSLLRRIVMRLEFLKQQPGIPQPTYKQVVRLLCQLLDTEHGAIVRQLAAGVSDAELDQLTQHIAQRQAVLQSGAQDFSRAKLQLVSACEMLGESPPADADLTDSARQLNSMLSEHLQHDAAMRDELKLLIQTMHNSLNTMNELFEQIGDDSAEIRQAQNLLSQELPDDPKQAFKVLQAVRSSLTKAGQKMGRAASAVKETMQTNFDQMQTLSDKLKEAEQTAKTDPLTGLANRRKLSDHLEKISLSNPNCFLMVDIDHFKAINDRYGHETGDVVLATLARLLRESVRLTDLVARLGGEEFCIVFASTPKQVAFDIAEKIRQAVEIHPFECRQGKIHISISIGVAEHGASESFATWKERADAALYEAKNRGRNQVVLAE